VNKGWRMEFLGRRARVRSRPDSAQITRERDGGYGEIVGQTGTIQEGIRSFQVRLDSGEWLILEPGEVEILD
jgi:hypothetical protein